MEDSSIAPVTGQHSRTLVERAKNIILQPKSEWGVIEAEPSTIGSIYRGYVAILALIPALCGALGGWLIGVTMFGVTVKTAPVAALAGAIVGYGLTLVGVYLLALIIDAVAPNFGAVQNRTQAFKVAAYSGTASWLAGVFQLIPTLGVLGALLGLYGLYLLYLGLPRLMKAPEDKALGYTAVVVVCAIVLALIVGVITAPVVAMFARNAPASQVSGTVAVPGGGSIDLGKFADAANKLEANAKQMEAAAAGGAPANVVPPAQLQALLPAALGSLSRTEISSASGGAGGIGGSNASARYVAGEASVSLDVTDMAAVGALASLGSALNVQSSKQTATGYEKTGSVDGRMTTEEWDSTSKSGKFSIVVADRFMISAEGRGVDMNLLKAAVASVGVPRLEALAK
jgi:hypothetical protein